MKKVLSRSWYVLAGLVASASLAPRPAHAWYTRYASSNCLLGNTGGTNTNWGLNFGQLVNNSTTASATLECPIADTDGQPRTSIAEVAAEVEDQSTTQETSVEVCIGDSDSFDTICGDSVATGTTAALGSTLFGFTVGTTPKLPFDSLHGTWWTTADGNHEYYHAFLVVTLGSFAGGGHEYMMGYWSSN